MSESLSSHLVNEEENGESLSLRDPKGRSNLVNKRENSFTLLEVMLSLAIFTIIAFATAKSVSQIQATKNIAFGDLDLYNNVRAAVSLMRSDVEQAFHVLYDDLGEEARAAVLQNAAVAHTIFDGRKKELIFTSLSHRSYYTGRRECEQTEISYFLQNKAGSKLSSLMKRESELIDDNLYQGGAVYTVIESVANLEFSYWDEKQQKWLDAWNSDSGSERDRFPMAVKMKIKVSENNHNLELETEFKIAFTNNDSSVARL